MRNKWSLAVTVALFLVTTLIVGGCSAGAANIGIMDVNKVMSESPKIKQFQEQLNAKGKEMSEALEKDKATLSPEEYQKRQDAVYGDFIKTKQDMEGQIDSSIKQALDQVAKDKKLSIIMYKNGVAHGGTDISDDVIKRMQ